MAEWNLVYPEDTATAAERKADVRLSAKGQMSCNLSLYIYMYISLYICKLITRSLSRLIHRFHAQFVPDDFSPYHVLLESFKAKKALCCLFFFHIFKAWCQRQKQDSSFHDVISRTLEAWRGLEIGGLKIQRKPSPLLLTASGGRRESSQSALLRVTNLLHSLLSLFG